MKCLLLWSVALAALPVAGCGWFGASVQPPRSAHYVLGTAYQAGGVWYYPRARYSADETGLAGVQPTNHPVLTTDGEAFDQTVLAAAHQTLQLPAIARVTNLENGRQIEVRINDRGPASPARLVAVTRRAAELLGFADAGVARVRLEVLEPESRAVVAPFRAEAEPLLAIRTAPRGIVQEARLAAPPGTVAADRVLAATKDPVAAPESAERRLPSVPDRLPEIVVQSVPRPGSLYIRLGTFSRREFAERQRAKAAGAAEAGRADATIRETRTGRDAVFDARIGPLAGVPEADAALARAIEAGIPDARIVVE